MQGSRSREKTTLSQDGFLDADKGSDVVAIDSLSETFVAEGWGGNNVWRPHKMQQPRNIITEILAYPSSEYSVYPGSTSEAG